jgi:hypothetical protein
MVQLIQLNHKIILGADWKLRMKTIIKTESIERIIYLIRGQKVMLDSDLATLYGVSTKVLVQAVKRNLKRFPSDFMFQLKNQLVVSLRSQIVTLKQGRSNHRKYLLRTCQRGLGDKIFL